MGWYVAVDFGTNPACRHLIDRTNPGRGHDDKMSARGDGFTMSARGARLLDCGIGVRGERKESSASAPARSVNFAADHILHEVAIYNKPYKGGTTEDKAPPFFPVDQQYPSDRGGGPADSHDQDGSPTYHDPLSSSSPTLTVTTSIASSSSNIATQLPRRRSKGIGGELPRRRSKGVEELRRISRESDAVLGRKGRTSSTMVQLSLLAEANLDKESSFLIHPTEYRLTKFLKGVWVPFVVRWRVAILLLFGCFFVSCSVVAGGVDKRFVPDAMVTEESYFAKYFQMKRELLGRQFDLVTEVGWHRVRRFQY